MAVPPDVSNLFLAQDQIVTPFDVSGGVDEHGKAVAIDYNKLIDKFGSRRVDEKLLQRFERLTGNPPHRLLRRGIVFSHRDLNSILDKYEKGMPFYLYTGRGPSSDSMHVGHAMPFQFTKYAGHNPLLCHCEPLTPVRYLQDAFDVPLIIMLTDDEKFLHTKPEKKLSLKDCRKFAVQNAMDIMAIGFDVKKTFIFADTEFIYGGHGSAFAHNILELAKRTTINQIKGTFGFNDSNNIGEFHFPAIQSATAFASSFPFIFGSDPKKVNKYISCLIPCAIDQDPYFRQCRDHAEPLGFLKPALVHASFLPSLRGAESKMSASDADSSIYLSDTPNQIKKKVGKAFSGGQDTKELHEKLGGRTAVDVSFQYLTFFLESNEELEDIRQAYESGKMSSGEMKARTTKELQDYVGAFQERRKAVTPEIVVEFMKPRQLICKGMPVEKERRMRLMEQKERLEKELKLLDEELSQASETQQSTQS